MLLRQNVYTLARDASIVDRTVRRRGRAETVVTAAL